MDESGGGWSYHRECRTWAEKSQRKNPARHDQESDRRHRVSLSHCHFANDGFVNASSTRRPFRFLHTNVPDLLSPFAPHIASELWEKCARNLPLRPLTYRSIWPEYDERLLVEDEVEIIVQVTAKCATGSRPAWANEEELKATALGCRKCANCHLTFQIGNSQ